MQEKTVPELTDEEIQQRYQENLEAQSNDQASRILKKNHREIDRLNKHAQGAVLENNYAAYKYAIEKLRKIYRQPYTDEIILTGWQTTRKQVWELLNAQTS